MHGKLNFPWSNIFGGGVSGGARGKANIERCEQFDLCAFAAICCVNRKEVSVLINFMARLLLLSSYFSGCCFLPLLGIVVSFL